jgi:hypothetical protein
MSGACIVVGAPGTNGGPGLAGQAGATGAMGDTGPQGPPGTPTTDYISLQSTTSQVLYSHIPVSFDIILQGSTMNYDAVTGSVIPQTTGLYLSQFVVYFVGTTDSRPVSFSLATPALQGAATALGGLVAGSLYNVQLVSLTAGVGVQLVNSLPSGEEVNVTSPGISTWGEITATWVLYRVG